MNISANDLEELPPSIGFLRHLRTLYADENFLYELPPEVDIDTSEPRGVLVKTKPHAFAIHLRSTTCHPQRVRVRSRVSGFRFSWAVATG